jgi:hypothetical protein
MRLYCMLVTFCQRHGHLCNLLSFLLLPLLLLLLLGKVLNVYPADTTGTARPDAANQA